MNDRIELLNQPTTAAELAAYIEGDGDVTPDDARHDYADRIKDDRTTFAQWGANTIAGPIVMGEYRRAQ